MFGVWTLQGRTLFPGVVVGALRGPGTRLVDGPALNELPLAGSMNDLALGVHRYEPLAQAPELASAFPTTGAALASAVEREALALGFARAGFSPITPLDDGRVHLEVFRESGFAATMFYLLSGRRDDPRALLPEAKSVVAVALAYGERDGARSARRNSDAPPNQPLLGQVARYAQGQDYHQVMKKKLGQLAARIATLAGRPILARPCVDTAPLLERELARRAGLGFQGKSAMLIAPGLGSYVLLGELLVDVELAPAESPLRLDGCGTCTACLDACPTAAFPRPYVLDARRCISYFTIEYDGPIPRELRRAVGTRVYGCDVCQEACPFNGTSRARPVAPELSPRPALRAIELVALLNLGSAAYRRLVRGTAMKRAHRTTLQRNAAVALGNTEDPRAVAPLARALREHDKDIVRAHAAWALGELAAHLDAEARAALANAMTSDRDPETREEARLALARVEGVLADTSVAASSAPITAVT
jgi:epoxyqueuosine reductase